MTHDFVHRCKQLVTRLLLQGYTADKLSSTLGKFYGHHKDLLLKYDMPLSRMASDIFDIENSKVVTGATCGAGNAHSLRNTWFHLCRVYDPWSFRLCLSTDLIFGCRTMGFDETETVWWWWESFDSTYFLAARLLIFWIREICWSRTFLGLQYHSNDVMICVKKYNCLLHCFMINNLSNDTFFFFAY